MWRYAREVKRESSYPGLVEEHRPNVETKLMGALIRTDAHGFRRPDPRTEEARRPDDRLVVVLGDSCTLGWGVPEGQTFSDLLERSLNERAARSASKPVTVLNAGIGNSNTPMHLARYARDGRPLRPAWVVLGYFINDAEPDPVPNDNLVLRHSALGVLVWGQVGLRARHAYRDYETYYRALYADRFPGWDRLGRALQEFQRLLGEDGIPMTVLLIPEMHEPKGFGAFADIYRRVAALAEARGFEVIDPSERFSAGPGEAYWVSASDAHPNAAAHAILAGALAGSRHAVSDLQPPSDRAPSRDRSRSP